MSPLIPDVLAAVDGKSKGGSSLAADTVTSAHRVPFGNRMSPRSKLSARCGSFTYALTGPLLLDRTVILATHSVNLCLPTAAYVASPVD
jgi:hypothetical protein